MKKTVSNKSIDAQVQRQNPAYEALGRVVRALTFPVIANGHGLSLLELSTLATIPYVNGSTTFDNPADGKADTVMDFICTLGAGQAFESIDQYKVVFLSLKEKGLIRIKYIPHAQVRQLPTLKNKPVNTREGIFATLTNAGISLLNTMTLNLEKSLDVLDRVDVRESLDTFSERSDFLLSLEA